MCATRKEEGELKPTVLSPKLHTFFSDLKDTSDQVKDAATQHTISFYFAKSENNYWRIFSLVDLSVIGFGTISFTTTGLLYSTTGMSDLSFAPTNGATSPQAISIDFSESTQFAGSSALKSFVQNGYPYQPDFHSKTLLK